MGKDNATVMPDTYAWASAYSDFWLERFYRVVFSDLYGARIENGHALRECLANFPFLPEIMLLGNFPEDRAAILSLCREAGINTVHGEDGFFPHYETMHADPLGFCWESSLPQMVFRGCSDRQRQAAELARSTALAPRPGKLWPGVRKPFILWPLQLIKDQVNLRDLNVRSWAALISDFRQRLPRNYQLVLKKHPRGGLEDIAGLPELSRELPNTLLVPMEASLPALLRDCAAAAGANSTVLHEARLLHQKPVYAYARSWFSNHEELFIPLRPDGRNELPRFDRVEDSRLMLDARLTAYTDWFLAQLLARQIRKDREANPTALKAKIHRLSYHSYVRYGDEIFE